MLCLFGNPDGHHRATSFSESLPSYHVIVNLQQAGSLAVPSLARAKHKHEPQPLCSWQASKSRSPKAQKSKKTPAPRLAH